MQSTLQLTDLLLLVPEKIIALPWAHSEYIESREQAVR